MTDFGISKQLEQTFGMARSFVGTAAYMAPERIAGDDYGTAADIWAVGIVLCECAQGAHPYKHMQSYYDLVLELSEGGAAALPSPPFSAELAALCAACLATDPAARPGCGALLDHGYIRLHAGAPPAAAGSDARRRRRSTRDRSPPPRRRPRRVGRRDPGSPPPPTPPPPAARRRHVAGDRGGGRRRRLKEDSAKRVRRPPRQPGARELEEMRQLEEEMGAG